jgi:MFS family permease
MFASGVHDSRYSWARLGATLLIAIAGNVGLWSYILMLPAVQADFGLDRAGASMPYTFTMLGFAAGNLLIGRAIDRFGVTQALIGAAMTVAAGFTTASLAQGFTGFAVLHLAIGVGTAAGFGPLMADISHWFVRHRGKAVAVVASGNYLSGALWPFILDDIVAADGWRAAYRLIAISVLVTVVPLALLLRRRVPAEATRAAETAARARVAELGISPRQLGLILAAAGVATCVAMSMPQVHIVALCADLGYGPAIGAEMLSLMLAGGVVSRFVSGVAADRFGGVPTLLAGSMLQCLALFLYLPFDGLTSLYVVSLVFGLSQGGIVPCYAVIVREYMPAREAGARVGFVIMATILGMAIGGWMSGWIYDLTGSYRMAFVNGIVWNAFNIIVMATLILRSRGPGARHARLA